MASFFSFSSPVEVDVHLQDEHDRQSVEVKGAGAGDKKGDLAVIERERCPVYYDGEAVRGQVSRNLHNHFEMLLCQGGRN